MSLLAPLAWERIAFHQKYAMLVGEVMGGEKRVRVLIGRGVFFLFLRR
jgi:hypothetical protein